MVGIISIENLRLIMFVNSVAVSESMPTDINGTFVAMTVPKSKSQIVVTVSTRFVS